MLVHNKISDEVAREIESQAHGRPAQTLHLRKDTL